MVEEEQGLALRSKEQYLGDAAEELGLDMGLLHSCCECPAPGTAELLQQDISSFIIVIFSTFL